MMKYSKWLLKLIFCCFFVLVGSSGYSLAAEKGPWSFVGFTKYRDALFIDKARLSHPSTGKVLVTAMIKPSAKSLFRRSIKREIPQYRKSLNNFKYLVLEMELICPEDRMRFLNIQFLDANNKILHNSADLKAPWKPVKTGTLWKDLEKAVCP
jgi:hypothetical protein